MANIQMPIEIGPSGKIQPLSDYIKIQISKCEELPEIDETMTNSSIMDQINRAIQETDECSESDSEEEHDDEEQEEKLMVFLDEIKNIKTRKPRVNISFKNKASKKSKAHHYTMKSRPNSNKADDDLFLPTMALEQEQDDGQSRSDSEQD